MRAPVHVRWLAVLQIVQGAVESVWGLLAGLSPGGTGAGSSPVFWIVLSLAGLATSGLGLVRMLAGILNLFWSGRRLGLVVSSLGLVSGLTCLCLPTSVGLCVYGWIVYTNAEVRRAFATGGSDVRAGR